MPDRATQFLKLVCLVLAALVVYEIARIVPRVNVLSGVVMPSLPTLAADGANGTNAVNGTNATVKTNQIAGTNAAVAKSTNSAETNAVAATPKTNSAPAEVSTNVTAAVPSAPVVENGATNPIAATNVAVPIIASGTNDSNSLAVATNGTNAAIAGKLNRKGTNVNGASAMMRPGRGMNPRGMAAAELPPETRARINRIYESEILGQVIRPMPMGLIGIAGDVAFLRAANGQTGLVKEGDTLGDLKLIQIGTNRVLVEQAGEKKELTIFDGYGGKSLLPAEKENPK